LIKKNLKKKDIVKNLSFKLGLSKNYTKNIIDNFIQILSENIKEENVNLKNLGSFTVKLKKERVGRNPKTKVEYLISSRKSINFTPSKKIYDKLNKYE
jgi:integration host factor subunit alpha